MSDVVIAIDQGNELSGYAVVLEDFSPMEQGKTENTKLLEYIPELIARYGNGHLALAIERFSSYGMPVGRTVFDACVWGGRFIQKFAQYGIPYEWVTRKDEKMALCNTMKAGDTQIRHALIDKFAKFDYKTGKGTRAAPDFFYGFSADMWSAYAIAYVYLTRKGHRYAKNEK